MISARRAALLGLTVPLSPIMIAVLGLWPEPEDDEAAPTYYGGGGGRRKRWRPHGWSTRRAHAAPLIRAKAVPQAEPRERMDDASLADKVRRHWDEMAALREPASPGQPLPQPQPQPPPSSPSSLPPAVAIPPTVSTAAPAMQVAPSSHEIRSISRRAQDDAAISALLIAALA